MNAQSTSNGPAFAPLNTYAPTPLADDPRPGVTTLAFQLLRRTLELHGNKLSNEHIVALHQMLTGFTRQALGGQRVRLAYPLDPGMGKTQAVIAWIAAAHRHGLLGVVSVAILTRSVAELQNLLRDLSVNGVPRAMCGLWYNDDRHDRQQWRNPGGSVADAPSDDDATSRPVLLATHSRAKQRSRKDIAAFNGVPRSITFWDESMITTEAECVDRHHLAQTLKASDGHLADDGPTRLHIRTTLGLIDREIEARKAGREPDTVQPIPVNLPAALAEIRRARSADNAPALRGVFDHVERIVRLLAESVSMIGVGKRNLLITSREIVPPSLDSVAILDASYRIRSLCKYDKTISLAPMPAQRAKRYDGVTINHFRMKSGRASVEADLGPEGHRLIAKLVVYVARQLRPDEALLIFTFLFRPNTPVDCVAEIRRALRAAGFDPDQRLPGPGGRLRFPILTWGNETSLSSYAYCTHVVFAGVLHRDPRDLAARIAGQRRKIVQPVADQEIHAALIAEVASALFQGINRAACRVVENGQARRATIWLPSYTETIKPTLEDAMPGVRWVSAPLCLIDPSIGNAEIVEAVRDYLRRASSQGGPVSSREMKIAVPALKSFSDRRADTLIRQGAGLANWRKVDGKRCYVPSS